jgi:hypothetical protein
MRPARRSGDISVSPLQHRASTLVWGEAREPPRAMLQEGAGATIGWGDDRRYLPGSGGHLWMGRGCHRARRLPGVLAVVFAFAVASSLR